MNREKYLKLLKTQNYNKLLIEEFHIESKGNLKSLSDNEILKNIFQMAEFICQNSISQGIIIFSDNVVQDLVKQIIEKYDQQFNTMRIFNNNVLIKIM